MASRTKKAVKNTISELLLELVTAICGMILPRLILSHFGSMYNGITSSITQFIGCIALLKSGIGSVTRAALYKPLANKDSKELSEIVTATEHFMRKIAIIFLVFVLIVACFYPLIVNDDFSWIFTFTLVIILSISTFAQYFFGLTYQMVLQADQRNYVITYIQIASIIINTIFAGILIYLGASIHVVKLASAIIFVFPPIIYMLYVKKYYKIDSKVKPNYNLISQRWDALGHQVANFINTNTDIIIATTFLGVLEVSVYSVYFMISNSIRKLVMAVCSGTTGAFGNIIAKKENKVLVNRFSQYELVIYMLSIFFFTITYIMFIPFINIYTRGINDVNYIRPVFALLICISGFFTCVKMPYEQIVFAAGKFKQTKVGAYIEAILNIVVSLICVKFIGLNGIIIGTIVAAVYRTLRYSYFVRKNIINRNCTITLSRMIFALLIFITSVIVSYAFSSYSIVNYIQWFISAIIISIIVGLITIFYLFIMFKNEFSDIIDLIKTTIFKRKGEL